MQLPSSEIDARHDEPSTNKRRRIIQACEECRDRKRKCDGTRPVCGACSRRQGQRCVWNDDRNTKGWSKNYVEGLRARIRELESAQPAAVNTPDLPQPAPLQSTSLQLPRPPADCSPHTDTLPPSVQLPVDAALDSEPESDSGDTEIDAMGVVRSAISTQGRTRRSSGYFGPSSTFSLLDDTYSAISGRSKNPRNGPPAAPKAKPRNAGRCDAHLSLSVPRRVEADELIESYWTWVHSLYPFLHRPSFLIRYESLWSGRGGNAEEHVNRRGATDYYDDVGDKLFHCILNLVFALGALFDDAIPLADRDTVSRNFFTRAKVLMDLDSLACGSTAMVQALLLMCQYLQSTDAASSCWNIVGLAVRVAQGVGLHHEPQCCREGPCENGHSQLQVQMRRRTWTGAILFDRVLSMTYGRPLMVHPSLTGHRLILPEAIDDEYLTGQGQTPGQQPRNTISFVDCYVAAVRLQDLIGKFVMSSNYMGMGAQDDYRAEDTSRSKERCGSKTPRKPFADDLDLQTMLDVDYMLVEWRQSLPNHLSRAWHKNRSDQQDQRLAMLLERQANVLEARHLHARLALFRPALSMLCKSAHMSERSGLANATRDSISWAMVVKSADLCVSVAWELADAITGNADPDFKRLPAPWYSVFYVHSCAMVLLLGYLCSPTYVTCADEASLMDSYSRCLSFFQECRPHSLSAQRCSKVLQVIQQQVLRSRSAAREGESFGFEQFPLSQLVPNLGDSLRQDVDALGHDSPVDGFQFDPPSSGAMLNDMFDTSWMPQFTF